jgi:hypothetical protein
LNRREIRRIFEQRFTARRMADDYADIYHQLTDGSVSALKPIVPDAIRVKAPMDENSSMDRTLSLIPATGQTGTSGSVE